MKTVNALEIRNHLGAVLDELDERKEPILVSKGRTVRAVLITPEDFQTRFLDRQAEDERNNMLEKVRALRENRIGKRDSVDVLRNLRGYED